MALANPFSVLSNNCWKVPYGAISNAVNQSNENWYSNILEVTMWNICDLHEMIEIRNGIILV